MNFDLRPYQSSLELLLPVLPLKHELLKQPRQIDPLLLQGDVLVLRFQITLRDLDQCELGELLLHHENLEKKSGPYS